MLLMTDYGLRVATNTMHQLGMNETIWFASQIFIAIVAMYPLLRYLQLHRNRHALIQVLGITAIGFLYNLILTWFYIVGTGVDAI